VRTSGLYGGGGPNFVLTMLHAAAQHTPLRVVSDQVSSPTWSGHLAPALLRLIARGVTGTVHLTNGGAVSWHGFAQAILAAQPEVDLAPVSAAARPTVARRPEYSVLDNRVWRLLGEDPLPHWREALSAYLDGVSDQGASGIAHSGGRA
jgi:dTDP-4-dehydrorhamnose reductase